MTVALIKKSDYSNALEAAIEMCGGFKQLKPEHKVLIKPNLVIGGRRGIFPPFGRVTTSDLMEKLVQLLIDKGCRDITISGKKQLAIRVCKMAAFKLGLYKEDYGYWDPYQSSEFDMNFYR